MSVLRAVRVGDTTDHGGRVISGDDTRIINDRKVARLGDLVDCPLHGLTRIISTNAAAEFTGDRRTAHLGCLTSCGARVVTGSDNHDIDDESI
jgi:uncharacterized Zn-binding protein involved in type VI secretion